MKSKHSVIAALTCALFLNAGFCYAAQSCLFSTPLGSSILQFGTLNPSAAADKSVSTAIAFTCTKSGQGGQINYQITETRSANYTVTPAGYKMQNAIVPTEYLSYQVTYTLNGVPIAFPYTNSSPNGANQTITVNGTVFGTGYQDAYYGSYQDVIQYNITP